LLLVAVIAYVATAFAATPAQAAFGFQPGSEGFDAATVNRDGSPAHLGGRHPYALHVHLGLNQAGGFSEGDLRDLRLALPPGLLLNPTGVPECSQALLHTPRTSPYETSLSGENCPLASQVGTVAVHPGGGAPPRTFGVFNLAPPYGAPGAIGFAPFGVPIVLAPHIREEDAGLTLDLEGLSQGFDLTGLDLTIWGTPWEISHDGERGNCLNEVNPAAPYGDPTIPEGPLNKEGHPEPPFHGGSCNVSSSIGVLEEFTHSYLTLPTTCDGPLRYSASATSWDGAQAEAQTEAPVPLEDCNQTLFFGQAQLTTDQAASRSGLVFSLTNNDGGGILNPQGIARPAIKKAVVALPEGLTVNPSLGAGLGTCSEADFARESVSSAPGAGCPNSSKVGEVEVQGMLGLPEPLKGSLFIAKPYQNPFGTLLAVYMVASSPARGIFVRSEGKIEPDLHTGQLLVTFENLPRLLYTHFAVTFREGQRSVMISPPACGSYPMRIDLASWAHPDILLSDTSAFQILHGDGGGPCPSSGLAPFHPQLEAGSINPNAGSYTPFYLHMTRTDAEQEITSYSATFPLGLLGKLAGVSVCPDAAIEAAKARTGPQGGEEELEAPSCPATSEIGHTLAGYGVGGVLAYAPGKLYLAGPYHGAPLSTVAIDSALVGPFDLGTVIVRSAIRIDPQTAQASIDSGGSDPIPHILRGIPIHLRDIRVYVDRPGFAVNPTSCNVLSSLSALSGAGADLSSPADDVPATATDRYQLLNCAALGFRPKLSIALRGATTRGRFPALRATYVPRAGNANIASAVVSLPSTEFLAQSHIREICTLHQFATQACPPSSVYGHARATTPLLDQPLEGSVYLRSSATHPLPDMVAALRGAGGIAIDVIGRVDSTKGGGLRASFESLPDAPSSKFVLTLQGGKKGLLENSANLCAAPSYASARFVAQSNATEALHPKLGVKCGKAGNGHKRGKR
jgi:hypothetical protein